MSTLEAARQMGMAVRSVQLMVDRGELQAWKTPGGHRRIARDSVVRWLRHSGNPSAALERRHTAVSPASVARSHPGEGKVLLIEDSVHFRNLVSLVVKQTLPNASFYVAGDGISGLVMYGQIKPDVLLVDLLMPGIDGGTLISGLRTSARFDERSLIVVTALEEYERSAYASALKDIAVVQKTHLATELPQVLLRAYAQAQAELLDTRL